jgi:hypothetical protein
MEIEIVLAPTMGRELFSDFPRRMLLTGYKADIDRIRLPIEVTRTELLASVDDLIATTANRVFGEFGFRPMVNILIRCRSRSPSERHTRASRLRRLRNQAASKCDHRGQFHAGP